MWRITPAAYSPYESQAVDERCQIRLFGKLKLVICARRGPSRRWVEFFVKPIPVRFSVPRRMMLNRKVMGFAKRSTHPTRVFLQESSYKSLRRGSGRPAKRSRLACGHNHGSLFPNCIINRPDTGAMRLCLVMAAAAHSFGRCPSPPAAQQRRCEAIRCPASTRSRPVMGETMPGHVRRTPRNITYDRGHRDACRRRVPIPYLGRKVGPDGAHANQATRVRRLQ
jgi:hypothetical protein